MPIKYDNEEIIKPGHKINWTKEMIAEYQKCKKDIMYWAPKYYYVKNSNPDSGGVIKINFEGRDYQKNFIKAFQNNSRVLLLAARQLGKCQSYDEKITVRNKKTKEVETLSIGEFFESFKTNPPKNEYDVNGYEILTDEGWEDIESVIKTEELPVSKLETENGKNIEASPDHLVATENGDKHVKSLSKEDRIITESGPSHVKSVTDENKKEHMYDLVLPKNSTHHYFASGILSHNSTAADCHILHTSQFKTGRNIAILANKASRAKQRLEEIKLAYRNLPPFLKVGVKTFGKTEVVFENECRILAGPTTEDSLRGEAISDVLLDEFAAVKRNIQEEFWAAVYPTISEGGNLIIVSTPMGTGDLFHQLVKGAKTGQNSFKLLEYDWRVHPKRDEEWKKETIEDIGKVRFNREYGLSFTGSVNTLIDSDTLKTMIPEDPKRVEMKGNFKIWDDPIPGHTYLVAVDVGEGIGENYSVAHVIDITDPPYFQVACYRDNTIDAYNFGEVIAGEADDEQNLKKEGIAQKYNDAFVIVETNSIGEEIKNHLWYEIGYENTFRDIENKGKIGAKSNRKTKKKAHQMLKNDMEADRYILRDSDTIDEIGRYIKIGKTKYGVRGGGPDDTVLALTWASYFLHSQYWANHKDWVERKREEERNLSEYEKQKRSDYEKLNPFIGMNMGQYEKESEEEFKQWLRKD